MRNYTLLFVVVFVFGIASSPLAATHIVQKGETMWIISQKYNVPFAEVLRLNSHYKNPDLIHPMDKIIVPDSSHSDQTAEADSMAQAVLNLVNAERGKRGLDPLTLSTKLNEIANLKSKDMAVNNYFSHTSPTYGTPFQMLKNYGMHYMSAGENIAKGQQTAAAVMQSWMNSQGHRDNILSNKYDSIGIGYYKSDSSPLWTQLFTGN